MYLQSHPICRAIPNKASATGGICIRVPSQKEAPSDSSRGWIHYYTHGSVYWLKHKIEDQFRGLLYCNASRPGEGPSSRSICITTDALCLKVSTKLGFWGGKWQHLHSSIFSLTGLPRCQCRIRKRTIVYCDGCRSIIHTHTHTHTYNGAFLLMYLGGGG